MMADLRPRIVGQQLRKENTKEPFDLISKFILGSNHQTEHPFTLLSFVERNSIHSTINNYFLNAYVTSAQF